MYYSRRSYRTVRCRLFYFPQVLHSDVVSAGSVRTYSADEGAATICSHNFLIEANEGDVSGVVSVSTSLIAAERLSRSFYESFQTYCSRNNDYSVSLAEVLCDCIQRHNKLRSQHITT